MNGAGPQNLDTRLLSFRSQGGDAVALVEDLLAADRPKDALDVVTKALKAAPSDPDCLILDGRIRLGEDDLLGAQASLLKAARVAPRRKEPFRWLGEVLLKRGDPARAAKVLGRAKAIDGSDRVVNLLLERAQRLSDVAKTAGAEEAARQAEAAFAPAQAPSGHEDRTVIRPELTEAARQAEASLSAPAAPEPEERTVIRNDLTEQLRSMTREVDAKQSAAQFAGFGDVDEEPTNLMTAREIPAAARRPAEPIRRKKRVSKTMAFESAAAIPPPSRAVPRKPPTPKRPPRAPIGTGRPPAHVPAEAADESPSTSVETAPKQTSPGAAFAPTPPSPRRRLPPEPEAKLSPGAKFSASDGDIDDALGGLESDPFEASTRAVASAYESERPDPFEASTRAVASAYESQPPAGDPFATPFDSEPPTAPRGDVVIPKAAAIPAEARPLAPEPAPPAADPFAADPFAAAPGSGPPPAQAASVSTGGAAGEDVDGILSMLREEGLFEPPSGESAAWAKRAEVKKVQASGTRTGVWLGALWVAAAITAVGGYFGWGAYVSHRHEQARLLVEEATAEAYGGDHADLVDAERHLREARELDPLDVNGPTLLLFVHAQRALEDGAFEAGYIRPALTRAEGLESEDLPAYLDVARAVLGAAEGHQEEALNRVQSALEARPRDPAILYIVGRLEQRLGGEDALTHLEAAAQGDESLNGPRIALAEARYDEGQAEQAMEILGQVLANDEEHLRARLWRGFLNSDEEDPAASLARLDELGETLEQHGAPTDQVISQLTRARLLRRQGDGDGAGEAVDAALGAGASEPRLLALVAVEGRRAGRMLRAEQAARTAVTGAPSNPDFRKLLAGIQLSRRNGRGALTTLESLPTADPDVIQMRAQAALLVGSADSLTEAAAGLDTYVEGNEDASVDIRALRIRIHTRQGQAREMLAEARQLVADAPGDPTATLALGEAALRTFDHETAVESLQQVAQASPDDSEGHFLLGRARRMAGDGEGAIASLRRAIEITAEHSDAKLTLGGLLLDMGQFEEAVEIYVQLSRVAPGPRGRAVSVAGRLGRVEALVGLGRFDDAQVQLEGLQDDVRQTPSARVTAAHLHLARHQAGEALTEVRSLAQTEGAGASVHALYGDALLAANQVEPAGAAYAAAVAADAGLPEGLLGVAEVALRGEAADDAVAALERASRTFERRIRPPAMHARLHTLLGRAHLLANQGEDALRELRAAAEIETAPPETHFFLGEALGAEAGAREAYQRYLELAPEGPYARRARRATR